MRDAPLNDLLELLAMRAKHGFFHNAEIRGPDFYVTGHLDASHPLQHMEELADRHGLRLYQKGGTIYVLNPEQLKPLMEGPLEGSTLEADHESPDGTP